MNCSDLAVVVTAVAVGFYTGKGFFFSVMELMDWVTDKTAHHRIVAFLLLVAILFYFARLFDTTAISIGSIFS